MNHSKKFKEFSENIKRELEARFPKLTVREHNDVFFGELLTIFKNGCSTTIKMVPYYEQHIKGRRKDDIINEIANNIKHEFRLSTRIKNKWNQEDFLGRAMLVGMTAYLFMLGIFIIGLTVSTVYQP